jgi:hypothetical protein
MSADDITRRRHVLLVDVTQAASEVSRLVHEARDVNLPVEPGGYARAATPWFAGRSYWTSFLIDSVCLQGNVGVLLPTLTRRCHWPR